MEKCTSGRAKGAGGELKANSRRPRQGGILKQRSKFAKTEERKTPLQQPDRRAALRVMAWETWERHGKGAGGQTSNTGRSGRLNGARTSRQCLKINRSKRRRW